jgi:hypothetical protein
MANAIVEELSEPLTEVSLQCPPVSAKGRTLDERFKGFRWGHGGLDPPHNRKVAGSNPAPRNQKIKGLAVYAQRDFDGFGEGVKV